MSTVPLHKMFRLKALRTAFAKGAELAGDQFPITVERRRRSRLSRRNDGQPHPAKDLTFMRPRVGRGGGIEYWVIESSGDYSYDWEIGKELGEQYLQYVGQNPTNFNQYLLGSIVEDMLSRVRERGELTSLELGFLKTVNIYATCAARQLVKTESKQ